MKQRRHWGPWEWSMRRYTHALMTASYIGKSIQKHPYVLLVVCLGGRLVRILVELRKNKYQQRFCENGVRD
ncbi:hypothetical protein RchiOBHm_Chr7g0232601 [Rosa chinensis]|uniref:Uncharacterized protein n=1 Tax=Rosa chinensis TaxID=74649 RepID=A0A2P6PG07_ROSCH|nr:hypothetical protein RchiOBHm_Chr7g0232601 [Rosa chinensis]